MAGAAPIYSLSAEDPARAETMAWAQFSAAHDQADFCSGWLAVLCTQIDQVRGGLLLLGPDQDGAYVPAAMWPDASRDLQYLAPTAERALQERQAIVAGNDLQGEPARDRGVQVGYPVEVAGVLHGAVVLDVARGSDAALQRAMRLVHWSTAWLVNRFLQRTLKQQDMRIERLGFASELVATGLQERRLKACAVAVANELATRLHCDRVSIGFENASGVELVAISHTATFDRRMSLVRLISAAMNEVIDLDTAIVYPAHEGEDLGTIAHEELANQLKDVGICSVPLLEYGHATGVLTLERGAGEAFDQETVELSKTIGNLLGPVLGLKRDSDRGILRRSKDATVDLGKILFGSRHPGAKLVALVLAVALIFISFATGEYRVSAKTVVEGAVQRAIVAPFEGHIADSLVRAGDAVQEGQLLCRLDDRDLRLDRTKLASEREQLLRKHRQAFATQDRAQMVVLSAQMSEVEAQIALVEDKIDRAALRAPFNGLVVSGDLHQLLGTPVEQGKQLFQIAPLDAYRVILEVDERDIAQIKLGQNGNLTLSGLPHEIFDFSVQQITPVSTSQEGRNFFRVEAHLQSSPERVRPGMEGIGKIAIGERRLIWIWTHSLVDWLRLWIWKELL